MISSLLSLLLEEKKYYTHIKSFTPSPNYKIVDIYDIYFKSHINMFMIKGRYKIILYCQCMTIKLLLLSLLEFNIYALMIQNNFILLLITNYCLNYFKINILK